MRNCPICKIDSIKPTGRCSNPQCSAYSHKVLDEDDTEGCEINEFTGEKLPPGYITCEECGGRGMWAKLYPGGHTEITCGYCDGEGCIEKEN